ncbi:MAG: hypothetical protein II821_01650 [Treponema sp.]|nr:hypothetical protein [Treponema sp.]
MKRLSALFCALLLISPFAFAEENSGTGDIDINNDIDQEKPEEEGDDVAIKSPSNLNEPGDQFIRISLMATFPLNFGGSFPLYRDGQLSIGGAGSLGYHRFITSWWACGIDVYFGYHPTIGENIFTYIPFVLNTTIQPTFKHFEFPITLGVGAAMENYLSRTYFPGLILKGQAGVFYRATPSWSFGAEGDYMYMPQWFNNSDVNDYGLFASFALVARYHF